MPVKTAISVTILALVGVSTSSARTTEECTSAVVGYAACAQHAPILWKNRDTGTLSNKIVFVQESPHCYLGLVSAHVPSGRHVWAGLNSAGFGIMNTVAYNLPQRSGEMEDLEGIIMADALRTCGTVEDFARYLEANRGSQLGARTNFGVIDANGKACLFEVHNHGYTKHDAAEAPGGYLLNTNFSRSGKEGAGEGYLRFERATRLFDGFAPGAVDFRTILTRHTRDLGHVLLEQPDLDVARETPAEEDLWIYTRDCINRPSTAAAAVIVGRDPDDPDSVATMWIIPGEPVTAPALPVWVEAGGNPGPLWEGDEAPLWRESLRIKKLLRPWSEGSKDHYLNLTRLENADGTGFLPGILRTEETIFAETRELLAEPHSPAEYSAFQDAMAARALETLRAIR